MSVVKINELLKKRKKDEIRIIGSSSVGPSIKVLIGSCSHCNKLKDNVQKAMSELNIPYSELEIISDLVVIAKMGIISTPALIVKTKLLSVGKVLSVEEIKNLLKIHY